MAVNCGGISPTLAESELFGHVKGAFTGATSNKAGFLEAANGGDLFLDGEIFMSLLEAKVLIEAWRRHYNEVRPHSSLEGKPPKAPETRGVNFALVS